MSSLSQALLSLSKGDHRLLPESLLQFMSFANLPEEFMIEIGWCSNSSLFANLPEELTIEILSKLPPKSLLRFKSVCKSWYALFNSPHFVTKHLSNSLQHEHVLIQRRVRHHQGLFSILRLPVAGLDGRSLYFDAGNHECVKIHGHSLGLLCLSHQFYRDVSLFNPTTTEFRQLPPSLPFAKPPNYISTNAVGFGYDAKSRDFKVVKVIGFDYDGDEAVLSRVEIYDLSKDRWREIEASCALMYAVLAVTEMYHEGTYYWCGKSGESTEIIQSFDMSEEVFSVLLVSQHSELHRPCERSLGVLKGSVVMFYNVWLQNTLYISKMNKDECGAVSWSELVTIRTESTIYQPLLFVNSDKLLMHINKMYILYDIKTQRKKKLPMDGFIEKLSFFVESLLSVKGENNITWS